MTRIFISVCTCAALSSCALLGTTSGGPVPVNSLTPVTASNQPVEMTLKRFDTGAAFSLSSERGNVVLLDVWATWCDPCRETLPQYQELAKRFADKGLKVYAVNVDADLNEVKQFVIEQKLTLPVLLDPEALKSEAALHVKLMPTSFLIDRKGVIRQMHEGLSDDLFTNYVKDIDAMLAE